MEKEDNLNNPDANRVDPSEDLGGGLSRSNAEGDEEESEDAGDNMQ